MSIKVDKGVPMPKNGSGKTALYPWDKMQPGDSFFAAMPRSSISGSIAGAARKYGYRFVTRSVVENEVAGTRVWMAS